MSTISDQIAAREAAAKVKVTKTESKKTTKTTESK